MNEAAPWPPAEAEDPEREATQRRPEDTLAATWNVIAGASHDLFNLITSINLMVDAIADGLIDDATAQRYHQQIRRQLRAMTALANDLVTVSRVNSQSLPGPGHILDVTELLDGALEVMAPAAERCGVELRGEIAEPLGHVTVAASADHLSRVLLNLIANAIRHSPRSGTVLVTAVRRDQILRLEVIDSGPGIPPQQRDHVFQPFTFSEVGESRPGHAGLGLAICRALLERHHGRIWIEPSRHGARVCVEVPGWRREPQSGRVNRTVGSALNV